MPEQCGVKICGTTSIEDAKLAAEYGAEYFGVVVEVDFSPRSLTIDQAKPLFDESPLGKTEKVALVFHMKPERLQQLVATLAPHAVQFLNLEDISHIRELKKQFPELQLWQSIHLPEAGGDVDFNSFRDTVQEYVDAGIDLLIFDTVAVLKGVKKFGGTGLTSDWDVVKQLIDQVETSVPIWLAGGIDPDNVAKSIRTVQPGGVDLCSGVEAEPGRKDPEKVRRLIENAHNSL
ncbi:MAG TPA: phosphoribosylanthranilate isomerase [Desulfocapsa sulfexigens]|nr:phosphoribosylanthranilate isomerase [Desulfocapsa sulfexigens]